MEFEPGERVEVDYAGDALEWIELATGEIRKAFIFVAALGFSQLLFAWAAEDMKSRNWLGAHRRMFAYYGGAPHVTVPDCLKQGVLKCQHTCVEKPKAINTLITAPGFRSSR